MNKHALVALHELGKLVAVGMVLMGVHFLVGVGGVVALVGGYVAVLYFRYKYAQSKTEELATGWLKEIEDLKTVTLELAEEHQELQKKSIRTKEEDMRMQTLETTINENIRRAQKISEMAGARIRS